MPPTPEGRSPRSQSPAAPKPPRPAASPHPQSSASFFIYPVSHVVTGLYRRLTEPAPSTSSPTSSNSNRHQENHHPMSASEVFHPHRTASPFQPPPLTPLTLKASGNASHILLSRSLAEEIRLLIPPRLQLVDTWQLAYSLDRDGSSLATLYENCKAYSHRSQRAGYVLVVRDASGGTITSAGTGNNNGGPVFGAYLTDPPHPAPHYYGTGECFLWRASTLPSTPLVQMGAGKNTSTTTTTAADGQNNSNNNGSATQPHSEVLEIPGLPLPPSADTTHLRGRSTTLRGEKNKKEKHGKHHHGDGGKDTSGASSSSSSSSISRKRGNIPGGDLHHPAARERPPRASSSSSTTTTTSHRTRGGPSADNRLATTGTSRSGTSTPERIRFKAFPYSGVNDYMIFCETGFLSVGGGDGHYGLWLDDSFEQGISSTCLTFGNEPLSDEGTKFDVLGVEIWYIGS
ncbi:hypothetical protein AJ80_02066 [Polytolypa hystricis UAMH7299]|uniref:Oxidation resistance protein 1 n=1 Tax=Polytolypa hystricis (strain UAMH7299) TaxID=1447883 RepID=A0A2B7YSF6_POLH7|nr:hypothetical protein AJ80_02066 [Polytolypa hystricis UAMH7299]